MNGGPQANPYFKESKIVERMQEPGVVVDVAPAHSLTLKHVVEMSEKPRMWFGLVLEGQVMWSGSRQLVHYFVRRLAILLLCFILGSMSHDSPSWATESEDGRPAYSMGVFPFLSPSTLEAIFSPIAAELGRALGREVEFRSSSSFEKFAQKLQAGEYEIAHIHPWDYVNIASKVGYLPVVTRNEQLYAVFVVRSDSPLKKASDLKGKIVGLSPRMATVSHLAKVTLLQAGIEPERDLTLQYFSTHQSCLQQLQIGNIDTCAAGPSILRVFQEQTKGASRVLMESPRIPQTLFVVHSRLPREDRDTIEKTLLSTRLSDVAPPIRDLFFGGNGKDGKYFRSIKDSDYDPVRRYIKILENMP